MFVNNKMISLRQWKRLIVLNMFSIMLLVIPYATVSEVSHDGIPALLIGFIICSIYYIILTRLVSAMPTSYPAYLTKYLGKWIAGFILLFYITKYLFCGIFVLRIFSEVIRSTLLPDRSRLLVISCFVLVSAYAAMKGLEVGARVCEILYFIILAPILIMLVTGLRNIDLANLTPLFVSGLVQPVRAGYIIFLLCSYVEFIVFIRPYIKLNHAQSKGLSKEQIAKKLHRKTVNYGLQGIGITFIISILIFVLTIGMVSASGAKDSLWSSVSIMQILKFPGSLLNRQDSIILSFWLLSTFSLLGGIILCVSRLGAILYQSKMTNCYIPIVVIILILGSAVPVNLEEFYIYYIWYMGIIGVPVSLVLPILALIIGKIRGSGEPTKSREQGPRKLATKPGIFLFFVIGSLFLTGCSNEVEVEDRDFVQAIGLDYDNGSLKTTLVFPDLKKLSKDGGETNKELLVKEYTGNNFYEIEENYKLSASKKLDFSHLQAVIIDSEFLKQPNMLSDFIKYVEQNYKISKNTYVLVSLSSIADIMEYNEKVGGNIGEYLVRLYNNNIVKSEKDIVYLGDLINEKNSDDLSVTIPVLQIIEEQLMIEGAVLVEDSMYRTHFDGSQMIYYDMLSGYGENARIIINSPDNQQEDIIVRLGQLNQNSEIIMENGKPVFRFILRSQCIVEKGAGDTNPTDADASRLITERIISTVNNYMKEQIVSQFNEFCKKQKTDYLNLLRLSRYKNRKVFQSYQSKPEQFIEDLRMECIVDVKVY